MGDSKALTVFGQDISAVNAIVLNTEEDAWKLLTDLQKDDYVVPEDVIFGEWCRLHIYLHGEKWNSSITPSIFPVFNDLQQVVYKAYAKAKYGDKRKRLTNEEKDDLEIIIHVLGGSANIFSKINLTAIAKACIGKMSGKQTLTAIIVIALALAGWDLYRTYLENQKTIRLVELQNDDKKDDRRAILEAVNFAGEEQKKKAIFLRETLQKNDVTGAIEDEIDDLHHDMLKSATKAEKSKINGAELDQSVAEELIKTKRQKATPLQINGDFRIISIDWGIPHSIDLRRIEDGLAVKAIFDLAWLPLESKSVIQAAEWKEDEDKVFYAKINARISSDGKIVNAELARVANASNGEITADK